MNLLAVRSVKVEYFEFFVRENVETDDNATDIDAEEMKRIRKDMIQMVKSIFKGEDVNADGFISHSEFMRKVKDVDSMIAGSLDPGKANFQLPPLANASERKTEL